MDNFAGDYKIKLAGGETMQIAGSILRRIKFFNGIIQLTDPKERMIDISSFKDITLDSMKDMLSFYQVWQENGSIRSNPEKMIRLDYFTSKSCYQLAELLKTTDIMCFEYLYSLGVKAFADRLNSMTAEEMKSIFGGDQGDLNQEEQKKLSDDLYYRDQKAVMKFHNENPVQTETEPSIWDQYRE